jgi:hypothetical protein
MLDFKPIKGLWIGLENPVPGDPGQGRMLPKDLLIEIMGQPVSRIKFDMHSIRPVINPPVHSFIDGP